MKNIKINQSKLNNQGIAHFMLPLAAVVIVAVAGTFALVVRAHNNSNSSTLNSASSQNKTSQKSLAKSNASTVAPASTVTGTTSSSATSSSSKPTTSSSTKTTTKSTTSSSTSSSTASSPPAPAATTLSTLTALITALDNGSQVNVTLNLVDVAGPISTAKARPIVFTFNGQSYFAYHQESPANFNTSAATTAGTMAITPASGNPTLTGAVLDKSGNLVDSYYNADGYSTGGD